MPEDKTGITLCLSLSGTCLSPGNVELRFAPRTEKLGDTVSGITSRVSDLALSGIASSTEDGNELEDLAWEPDVPSAMPFEHEEIQHQSCQRQGQPQELACIHYHAPSPDCEHEEIQHHSRQRQGQPQELACIHYHAPSPDCEHEQIQHHSPQR